MNFLHAFLWQMISRSMRYTPSVFLLQQDDFKKDLQKSGFHGSGGLTAQKKGERYEIY